MSMTVGFLSLARVAVPARFALALALVPFVEDNIMKPFFAHNDDDYDDDDTAELNCEGISDGSHR